MAEKSRLPQPTIGSPTSLPSSSLSRKPTPMTDVESKLVTHPTRGQRARCRRKLRAAAPTFLRHAMPYAAHQHHLPRPPPRHATAHSRAPAPYDPDACSPRYSGQLQADNERRTTSRAATIPSNHPLWGRRPREPTNLPPKLPKIATQPKVEPLPRPMEPPRTSLPEATTVRCRCPGIHQTVRPSPARPISLR